MRRKELKGFVASLVEAGLVSTDTIAAAETQFNAWSAGADKIAADLAVKLQLSHAQVRTLMQLDQRVNGRLSDAAKRKLIAAAIAAAESLDAKRANIEHGARSVASQFNHESRSPISCSTGSRKRGARTISPGRSTRTRSTATCAPSSPNISACSA